MKCAVHSRNATGRTHEISLTQVLCLKNAGNMAVGARLIPVFSYSGAPTLNMQVKLENEMAKNKIISSSSFSQIIVKLK